MMCPQCKSPLQASELTTEVEYGDTYTTQHDGEKYDCRQCGYSVNVPWWIQAEMDEAELARERRLTG